MTSGLGSLALASDPENPFYALDHLSYRSSKAALNMLMVEWNKIVGREGMRAWAVAPVLCATNLGGDAEAARQMGARDPALGAALVLSVMEGKRDADVGKMLGDECVIPW